MLVCCTVLAVVGPHSFCSLHDILGARATRLRAVKETKQNFISNNYFLFKIYFSQEASNLIVLSETEYEASYIGENNGVGVL